MAHIIKRTLRRILADFDSMTQTIRCHLIYGLQFGKRCKIGGNTRIRIVDGGSLRLGNGCIVERFCEITASGGNLKIGDNSFVGQGTIIVSKKSIKIGNDCLIAEHVTIRDQNHDYSGKEKIREAGFVVKAVEIGDDTWIGAKCCILAGVRIGRSCIVGAGSVVTEDLPDRVVAVGSPARVIRMRDAAKT